MTQDVFVSYSSKDKSITDAIIATLEQNQIRCWYAPRDIKPSDDWGKAIARAIDESKIFLIVFSSYSNQSQRVLDELNLAISCEIPILPFRIENLEPDGAMRLHLSSRHWLDAYEPSWESHLRKLINTISTHLNNTLAEDEIEIPQSLVEKKKKTTRNINSRQILIAIAVMAIIIAAGWAGLTQLNLIGEGSRGLIDNPAEPLPASPTAPSTTDTINEVPVNEDNTCSLYLPDLETQMHLEFCDSFDSNINGWRVGTNSSSDISENFKLQDGVYSWQIECSNNNYGCVSPSYPNKVNRQSDFLLAADFSLIEGSSNLSYGLRFRNDGQNYYEFLISDTKEFSVNSWFNGNFYFLVFNQDAPMVEPGGMNHLAVNAIGSKFIFYINNEQVAEIENDYISEGIPGVVTSFLNSGQGSLLIDNFSLHIP